MPRFKLILEYDGKPFVGWQRQANGLSIQEALEGAIFAMTGENATAHGAGRTDAGVHALGQVAHVDLTRDWAPFRLQEGLNALLHPRPVAILAAERIAADFDARHSASARHYLYRIVNRRAPLALDRGRAWRVKPRLDAKAMQEAARALTGKHDFSTFRDSQCQANSPIRTLDRLDVRREGDEILFEASARSFLHRQVRSMVGSLTEVGSGRWSVAELKAAFEAADRRRCGQVAPADGLYLVRVDYAEARGAAGGVCSSSPANAGEGTARRAVEGVTDDESAIENHRQRPAPSSRPLAAGSAALEPIAPTHGWIAGISPPTSDRALCARFLLRKGAAGDRDRWHEPRCRQSAGARPSSRRMA